VITEGLGDYRMNCFGSIAEIAPADHKEILPTAEHSSLLASGKKRP